MQRFLRTLNRAIWDMPGKAIRRMSRLLDPLRGLFSALEYRFDALVKRCSSLLAHSDTPWPLRFLASLVDTPVRWLKGGWEALVDWEAPRPIRFILGLPGAVLRNTGAWVRTREPRFLVQGLPALLVFGLIGFVLFAQTIKPEIKTIDRYRGLVEDAVQEQDWDSAALWLRKLNQLGLEDDETRFRTAVVAKELGRHQRAVRILRELAPDDRVGYPEAHFWAARDRSWNLDDPEDVQILVHHLDAATKSRFAVRVHAVLAEIYERQGNQKPDEEPETEEERQQLEELRRKNYDQALYHLRYAVTANPDLRFQMARLYRLVENTDAAKQQLQIAERDYGRMVESNRGNVDARLRWAIACSMQGQYEKAENIIKEGLSLSRDPRLDIALADIYASLAALLEPEGDKELSQRLKLLQQALSYSPSRPHALYQLARLLPLEGDDEPGRTSVLQDALADGKAAAVVHLILAVYDQDRDAWRSADLHLEQAYRLSSDMAEIVNNLATMLTNSDPPYHQLAYDLVTAACKIDTEDLRMRETRGQVLFDLGRWAEAIEDLEAARSEMEGDIELHDTLAQAYQQVGDTERAKEHRALAREARAAAESQDEEAPPEATD